MHFTNLDFRTSMMPKRVGAMKNMRIIVKYMNECTKFGVSHIVLHIYFI